MWLCLGLIIGLGGTYLMKHQWSPWQEILVMGEPNGNGEANWSRDAKLSDFHESSQYLARANNDGQLELWDLKTSTLMWVRGEKINTDLEQNKVGFVGFLKDQLHIYGQDKLSCYDLSGKLLREARFVGGKRVHPLCNRQYVVIGSQGRSALVNLENYVIRNYDYSMMTGAGKSAAGLSADGKRLLLGNDGICVVLDVESGAPMFQYEGPAMEEVLRTVGMQSAVPNTFGLSRQIEINTLKRNGTPSEMLLLPSGKQVILLFGDYTQGLSNTEYTSRVECINIEDGKLVWESRGKGLGKNLALSDKGKMVRFCELTEHGQKLVRLDVTSGLVMQQDEYSIVLQRPYFSQAVRELPQEYCTLSSDETQVVFYKKEPWIVSADGTGGLMPLFKHKGLVTYACFSKDSNLIMTQSQRGVGRVYQHKLADDRGFMNRPLGWILYGAWLIWSGIGVYLIWGVSQRTERKKESMPIWYAGLAVLAAFRLAHMLTDNMADWVEFSAAQPWKRVDIFYMLMLLGQMALTGACLYLLACGKNLGLLIALAMGVCGTIYYMFLALVSLGFFHDSMHGIVRTWWGTPLHLDSDALHGYILLNWIGYTVVVVILLGRACREWVNRKSKLKQADADLSPVTQGWGQYRT